MYKRKRKSENVREKKVKEAKNYTQALREVKSAYTKKKTLV